MYRHIKETFEYIRTKTKFEPEAGIILGTGLGRLIDDIDVHFSFDYNSIPNFPISMIDGKQGRLIFGLLEGRRVVAMQGHFHYYEGFSMEQVTHPVRVMKLLGIKHLLLSNASGALNPELKAGDMMIINDHINLMLNNPLIGRNMDSLGPRFPDMSRPYDADVIKLAQEIGNQHGLSLKTGVYVGVSGPNLETPAEYRYLRMIGGDAVGMSTVPEILVARHMNIPSFAISVVTDEGWHSIPDPLTIEQVVAVAKQTELKTTLLLKEMIKKL